jgi:ectoine hydroxylase-related dioxygenase (phytanoyl-CoA dioxygenase family)
MFQPNAVATVWIALDDMIPEVGPLVYVKGSHKWGDGRVGSSQSFFQDKDDMDLLHDAALQANMKEDDLKFVSMTGLKAGGLSIHDGMTWHGSAANKSRGPRRGIGLHFVPVNVRWTEDAMKSLLWKKYVQDFVKTDQDLSEIEINEEDFPVTWLGTV